MQHGVKRVRLSEQARKSKLEKDRAKIVNYRVLTKKVFEGKKHRIYTKEALNDTTNLLSLNPEFNAMWNYRRDIFVHLFSTDSLDRGEALNTDLAMSMEMMKMYPKCYWIWNHRRWCLENLDLAKIADWKRELAIASKVLSVDSRNFHGWQYRRYVVSKLEKKAREVAIESRKDEIDINLREFQYTTEVINKSTSNFSAWHNRTKLIAKLFQLLGDSPVGILEKGPKTGEIFDSSLTLLKHELNLVKTGMYMDADDTSVWLYMQWLLTENIFVERIPKNAYLEILETQLSDVRELNDLEKEDSPIGMDNVWCLKTIIFLRALLNKEANSDSLIDEVTRRALVLLVELDPLRKGHYLDQLSGMAPVIC